MWLGVVASRWSQFPASGVFPAAGLNYADFERASPIVYREMERAALESLLAEKASRAIFVEAWGALYLRDRLGIHQVHSRRASCSVRTTTSDATVRFDSIIEKMPRPKCSSSNTADRFEAEQAQAVQDDEHGAALVTDYAERQIDFLCERKADQDGDRA